MKLNKHYKSFLIILVFFVMYFFPLDGLSLHPYLLSAFGLLKWYAKEHVILCLLPAFLIAGAVSVLIKSTSIIKLLGANTKKIVSYSVASVAGTVLAVCSCTILPLFAGIYKMGAGIGPASTFLYSGPAISVLAIFFTFNVLGVELGVARVVSAVSFSIIIGLLMNFIFKETNQANNIVTHGEDDEAQGARFPLKLTFFVSMVAVLVFANWADTSKNTGVLATIYAYKWHLTVFFAAVFLDAIRRLYEIPFVKLIFVALPVVGLIMFFPQYPQLSFGVAVVLFALLLGTHSESSRSWLDASWTFGMQIFPLLFIGVFLAGILLGSHGSPGLIPAGFISGLVGENTLFANFFASIAGAFMYFATLTEIPIIQGLISNGMAKGPALSLLLAGPALSLPNMIVIKSVIGLKRTVVFVSLVVFMATLAGFIYGNI